MSKRLPGIYFGPGVRTIVTSMGHDHSPNRGHDGASVVVCEDGRCRSELLRMGGIELVEKTYYAADGVGSFNITQEDGRAHIHEPGKDHSISCSSPTCIAAFEGMVDVPKPFRVGMSAVSEKQGYLGRSPQTRPLSPPQREELERAKAEAAEREARIEAELISARRVSLIPTH
jgi:hypothetical protein